MKKATISLIFLIASILTFTNQLLNPEHQSGSHRISNDVDTNNNVKWSPYPSKAGPQRPVTIDTTEADKIRNEIKNKIDRLAKNDNDKRDIENAFEIDSTDDLNKLKKAKEYADILFEDYDTNIHYLRNIPVPLDNDDFVYFINRKKNIDQKIDALSKTANHALDGVSLAVAMANLPTVSSEYNHNISASYGTYAGSHSFALGLSGHIANDRLNYKLSGAVNTKGNLAFGVGVGVNLGKKNQSNKELLDRIEKLENLVKQLQNK